MSRLPPYRPDAHPGEWDELDRLVDAAGAAPSDEAVGSAMRALHDRGHAADVVEVAEAGRVLSFRELEALGRSSTEGYLTAELAVRLEFAELIPDEEFEALGLDGVAITQVRHFARDWVKDIKLRRVDDGDAEFDHDVPDMD